MVPIPQSCSLAPLSPEKGEGGQVGAVFSQRLSSALTTSTGWLDGYNDQSISGQKENQDEGSKEDKLEESRLNVMGDYAPSQSTWALIYLGE